MAPLDPWALLMVAAVALCWGLAVVLLRVGATGSAARRLALLLAVEGLALGTSGPIGRFFAHSEAEFYAAHPTILYVQNALHGLADCGMLALYPAFLAAALQTPLTRPLGRRTAQWAAAGLAVALYATMAFGPRRLAQGVLFLCLMLLFLFAFAASLQAWRSAKGDARRRAGFFAVAFGVRDVSWAIVYGNAMAPLLFPGATQPPGVSSAIHHVYFLGTLFAVPLIAYGILRGLVADIDVRIRWTIRQSTVAAALVAVYFAISEGANRFLSTELGNVAGLFATALVVFFMAPLQRFAERVAAAAVPHTAESPAYAAFRKLKAYEAAVADLLADQVISDRERALLERLRDSLGILPADAEAVEKDLKARA